MLEWSLTKIASGLTECPMVKEDSSILMAVATKELLLRAFQVVKEGSSALRDGIMKENCIKNKLREEESLLFKILDIDMQDNGKAIFPMEEVKKLG